MAEVKARILDVPDDGMHVIRRLGKAVVAQWDNLDDGTRDRLLKQAVFVHDDYQTTQLQEQIETFIAKWKRIE